MHALLKVVHRSTYTHTHTQRLRTHFLKAQVSTYRHTREHTHNHTHLLAVGPAIRTAVKSNKKGSLESACWLDALNNQRARISMVCGHPRNHNYRHHHHHNHHQQPIRHQHYHQHHQHHQQILEAAIHFYLRYQRSDHLSQAKPSFGWLFADLIHLLLSADLFMDAIRSTHICLPLELLSEQLGNQQKKWSLESACWLDALNNALELHGVWTSEKSQSSSSSQSSSAGYSTSAVPSALSIP